MEDQNTADPISQLKEAAAFANLEPKASVLDPAESGGVPQESVEIRLVDCLSGRSTKLKWEGTGPSRREAVRAAAKAAVTEIRGTLDLCSSDEKPRVWRSVISRLIDHLPAESRPEERLKILDWLGGLGVRALAAGDIAAGLARLQAALESLARAELPADPVVAEVMVRSEHWADAQSLAPILQEVRQAADTLPPAMLDRVLGTVEVACRTMDPIRMPTFALQDAVAAAMKGGVPLINRIPPGLTMSGVPGKVKTLIEAVAGVLNGLVPDAPVVVALLGVAPQDRVIAMRVSAYRALPSAGWETVIKLLEWLAWSQCARLAVDPTGITVRFEQAGTNALPAVAQLFEKLLRRRLSDMHQYVDTLKELRGQLAEARRRMLASHAPAPAPVRTVPVDPPPETAPSPAPKPAKPVRGITPPSDVRAEPPVVALFGLMLADVRRQVGAPSVAVAGNVTAHSDVVPRNWSAVREAAAYLVADAAVRLAGGGRLWVELYVDDGNALVLSVRDQATGHSPAEGTMIPGIDEVFRVSAAVAGTPLWGGAVEGRGLTQARRVAEGLGGVVLAHVAPDREVEATMLLGL